MKKLLCINISIIFFVLLVLSGCGNRIKVDENNMYNFFNYQNEEVFDIKQINLSNSLGKDCISYKFTYISDCYQIKAFISIPLSFIQKQVQGKCILYNRGGNSRIGLLNDEDTAKLCVATNRIVIASQYRGADGGTGKDEFGGNDINDVIKLIDLCEKQFLFIDLEDFCVAGVSRGGMMTYMTAKQDNRVKRIIAISAVSDLFKSYEEREDMQKLLFNYIGATPEQNPDEYEKRSAVYWADKINIPVLIIHSKYDKQVSYEQSENLYNKLKENNTDVTFIARDDDVHGLSNGDFKATLDWFDNSIKGD